MHAGPSLIPRLCPAFRRLQYGKATESWVGPGNEAMLALVSSGALFLHKTTGGYALYIVFGAYDLRVEVTTSYA